MLNPARALSSLAVPAALLVAVAGLASADNDFGDAPRKLDVYSIPLSPDLAGTFGSDLVKDPKQGNIFWGVTDSNIGPDAAVRLVKMKIHSHAKAAIEDVITLRNNGQVVTGSQLDPEGLAIAHDGSFWISDESGPYLVHVSKNGELLQTIATPDNIMQNRRTNQGLEGLAISSDGRTLYAILQSGLLTETDRRNTILLTYDIASGSFAQHPYLLDAATPGANSGANGLVETGPGELLVLERDNLVAGPLKRIYRISVPATPGAAPLAKTLVVDLAALGYTFEKAEGIAAHAKKIWVINDNDGDLGIPTEIWQLHF